jgi:ADP-heptose:LPS heptosyltransferase
MWDNNISVKILADIFFDAVKVDHDGSGYDTVFCGLWSHPDCLCRVNPKSKVSWIRGGSFTGTHEVSTYLNMIGASYNDFKGFLVPDLPSKPVLDHTEKPVVALANSSHKRGSGRGCITRWDKFPELSKKLINLGFEVVLVGQDEELDRCHGKDFVDKLDILGTMRVISQCDLIVCPDMGLMHVADAFGIPIVLLAGPTPVTKSGPIVSKCEIVRNFFACAPCFQSNFWNICKSRDCMNSITVDQVLERVCKLLPMEAFITRNVVSVASIPYFVSLFNMKNTKQELVYDPSEDRIGDLFGAVFLLKKLKEQKPHLKISWYNSKRSTRDNSEWLQDFNIFDWVDFEVENFYDKIPRGCKVISSRRNFSVWHDLTSLDASSKWYPKMKRKERPKNFDLPEKYVSLHVLLKTKYGERSTRYVGRREMDLDKYDTLCSMLLQEGIHVVRIGHSSDHGRALKNCMDLSCHDLSLDTSLRIIAGSDLFIGGDTGHKLVASAMDIPCIIEIDDGSCGAGGLGGCDPSIVTSFRLGTKIDIIFKEAMKVLFKK